MSKLYLVTGGGGFLAYNIILQLLEKGERVRTLELPTSKSLGNIPKAAEVIKGDILDEASLEKFFTFEPEDEVYVLHIASIVYLDEPFNRKVYDVNVNGTKNIIRYCEDKKDNVKKLVYCGSTSAIPELPLGQTMYEVDNYEPLVVRGCYAQTKAEAARAVIEAARYDGLNACVCLPSAIFGPNDYAMGAMNTTIQNIVTGKLPVSVPGAVSLCDVRDLANGFIQAAEKGRAGESYNFAAEEVPMKTVTDTVAEVAGVKAPKVLPKAVVAKIMVPMLDAIKKLTGFDLGLTSFGWYQLVCNHDYSYQKAVDELGYHLRPFRETIADTINWMREAGKI